MYVDVCLRDLRQAKRLSKEVYKQSKPIFILSHDNTTIIDAGYLANLIAIIGKDCKLFVNDDINPRILNKILRVIRKI